MWLVNNEYFIKNLSVPASLKGSGGLDISSNEDPFEPYIDKYGRLLAQKALGNILFDQLDAAIDANGNLNAGADQKWKDLVNGKSYTYNDKSYKWKGLIYTEGTFKGSVLAHFIFYNWRIEKLSRTSAMGQTTGEAVNQTQVDSTPSVVDIWNEFIEMYQGDIYASGGAVSYINGIPFIDYASNESDYVSLLTFLSHNEETYPDATKYIFKEGYQNTLSI